MVSELAYVFWHWPRPGVSVRLYERKLGSFQSAMGRKPILLSDLLSYRVDSLPWAPKGVPLYEDWYLVKDFGALGSLNDAAVSGGTKDFHDSVAKDYLMGAGGVFKLIRRNLPLREAGYATWIEKVPGTSYQSYYEDVAKVLGSIQADLWRRQMVLGPSPQFCVHSVQTVRFPKSFRPFTTKVRVLPSL